MILDCYKPTFARRFDGAASDSLQLDVAAVTAVPLTMACWFNAANITIGHILMWVGDKDGTNEEWNLIAKGDVASDPVQARSRTGGTNSTASTSTGYSANRWHHAAGVFASATSRAAFIDGGSKGTNATSSTPTGADRTAIGISARSTPAEPITGQIAWPAIWNTAISDAEVALLASGAHPLTVRPESLVAFWDWTGAEKEYGLRAAFPLTNSGSLPVNGPAFLTTRIPRPWLLGAGYQASATTILPRMMQEGLFCNLGGRAA